MQSSDGPRNGRRLAMHLRGLFAIPYTRLGQGSTKEVGNDQREATQMAHVMIQVAEIL